MFMNAYIAVIGCGILALLSGLFMIRSIFSLSTGTVQMQKIALAIQNGAKAYLNRQYTITIVGLFIFAFLTWVLGW